jgi:hypothetical protein
MIFNRNNRNSYFYKRLNINEDSSITEETIHRIKKVNRPYFAYKGLMTCKLISKHTKRKIYMTLIRPIVTWILSVRDINNLLVFERDILRKIFGPIKSKEG